MQQVKQQQKEEGFDTAKDYEENFPSLGGDLGGNEEFDENDDDQYEDVDGEECEEIIIDEEDDKTIQAFTGGGVRNAFHPDCSRFLPPMSHSDAVRRGKVVVDIEMKRDEDLIWQI